MKKGKLTIDLTNIKIANNPQWAQAYTISSISYGIGKNIGLNEETDQYEWVENDGRIKTAPMYTDMDVEDLNNEEVENHPTDGHPDSTANDSSKKA